MTSGKMVLEIRPKVDFHKGEAVKEILKTFASPGLLPIYLGDDQTDEDAFRVLESSRVSRFTSVQVALPRTQNFFSKISDEVQRVSFPVSRKVRGAGILEP